MKTVLEASKETILTKNGSMCANTAIFCQNGLIGGQEYSFQPTHVFTLVIHTWMQFQLCLFVKKISVCTCSIKRKNNAETLKGPTTIQAKKYPM